MYKLSCLIIQALQDSLNCLIMQVLHFSVRGLRVACVSGSTSPAIKDQIRCGNFQLIFFTPETLINDRDWRNLLTKNVFAKQLNELEVDEAHVVKIW